MHIFYKTAFLLLLFAAACGPYSGEKVVDTPTSGSIKIGADEEFEPLTKAEVTVYTSQYVNTKMATVFGSEDSMVDLLKKDSVRLILASRKLTKTEESYFNDKKLFPEQVKIGGDAITFIVNNNNPDTMMSVEQIKAVFMGKDSLWQQINKGSQQDKITVVFDYANSGNAKYITQNLMPGQKFPAYCFALYGNRQVVEYVSKTPNSLGIIAQNWLGNEYDTSVINALKKVKMVALAQKESTNPADYYLPVLDNMISGEYPLCRDIYIISREAYTGLGSGLISFVMSNKGQRIIYREGLLPARMPSHNVRY